MQELLKNEVERIAGFKMKTTGDFDTLTVMVYERTKERISATTLKRFWGYLCKEQVTPRTHTFDVLAQFVGYRDYDHFMEQAGQARDIQSGMIFSNVIRAEELKAGQKLVFTWMPDRRMVAEYKGNGMFVIREAEKTHLHVGDTFQCFVMVQREPLVLDKLTHEGLPQRPYIIGNIDGVIITQK
jgi:hypothetical protein